MPSLPRWLCRKPAPATDNASARQQELGAIALALLESAGKQNSVHSVGFGDAGEIVTWHLPHNGGQGNRGGRYTVVVHFKQSDFIRPCCVLNLSVDVVKEVVHVLWGPNGPEDRVPISEFPHILVRACTYVREWRLLMSETEAAV